MNHCYECSKLIDDGYSQYVQTVCHLLMNCTQILIAHFLIFLLLKVCPICKVMPWGNTQQISDNFLDHIKLRHQFDYDRFVVSSFHSMFMLYDTFS